MRRDVKDAFLYKKEEAFRDMKLLFGFKCLVFKNSEQSRVEQILMLVVISIA